MAPNVNLDKQFTNPRENSAYPIDNNNYNSDNNNKNILQQLKMWHHLNKHLGICKEQRSKEKNTANGIRYKHV